MKKILTVLLAIVCFCFSFFTGCKADAKYEEIKISGKEVLVDDLENWIETRQETYIESDTKKYIEGHWFNIDVKSQIDRFDNNGESKSITLSLKGKMRVAKSNDENELDIYYELEIKKEIEEVLINDSGEEQTKKIAIIGSLMFIDNIAYADLTLTEKTENEEHKEKNKIKGSMRDVLDFDLNFETYLGLYGKLAQLYGVNVYSVVYLFKNVPDFKFYKDKANGTFFMEYKKLSNEQVEENPEGKRYQFKFDFAKNSAIIEEGRVYMYENFNLGTSRGIVKHSYLIERTNTDVIKTLNNSDEYTPVSIN